MKKQSFRYSLLGFIGLLLVLMIFIGGFSVLVIKSVEARYSNMIDKMLAINGISSDINSSVFYFDKYFTTKSDEDKSSYEKFYNAALNKLKQVDSNANEDLLLNLKDLQSLLQNYHSNGEIAISKFMVSGKNEECYKYFVETKQIASYSAEYVKRLNDSYLKYNDTVYKTFKYKMTNGRAVIVIFLVCTIIFCIIFSAFFSRTITIPIGALAASAEEIAKGNFEIEAVDPAGMYEIDLLQSGFTKMAQEIKLLIEKIQENAVIEKKLNEQEMKNLLFENMLKESQLKTLQSQINPHFLFNTLNAIAQTAIIEGASVTEELINAVSELLRYSLSMIDRQSRIEAEISIIKQYIIIQETRFKDRIKFHISVDKTLDNVQVPGMILQPLVENAFVHGIESLEEGGEIMIKVYRDKEYCIIMVSDNGCGIPEDKLKRIISEEYVPLGKTTGIGVKNVIRRLRIMYKNEDVFKIDSEENNGTRIYIKIPIDGGSVHA